MTPLPFTFMDYLLKKVDPDLIHFINLTLASNNSDTSGVMIDLSNRTEKERMRCKQIYTRSGWKVSLEGTQLYFWSDEYC